MVAELASVQKEKDTVTIEASALQVKYTHLVAATAEQEQKIPSTELPETPAEPSLKNVPIPEQEPEPEPEMSNIEREFRELVTGLLAAGVAPTDMMDDPRWEDLNERASAEGFETWPVFLQLAAM